MLDVGSMPRYSVRKTLDLCLTRVELGIQPRAGALIVGIKCNLPKSGVE